MRYIPEHAVDIGVPAIVVGFESMTSGRRIEGVLVQDSLQIVSVQ